VEITNQRTQICTLYGCEKVKPIYWLIGYKVININTMHIKQMTKLNTKRAYPYVTLDTIDGKNKKCLMHHLIALAYIKNEPYDVIEHLDDNPMNYNVDNLMFSNQLHNVKRSINNKTFQINRKENIYNVILLDGTRFNGTMKEIAKKSNIDRKTLYNAYYANKPYRNIQSVTLKTGQQTIENIPTV